MTLKDMELKYDTLITGIEIRDIYKLKDNIKILIVGKEKLNSMWRIYYRPFGSSEIKCYYINEFVKMNPSLESDEMYLKLDTWYVDNRDNKAMYVIGYNNYMVWYRFEESDEVNYNLIDEFIKNSTVYIKSN